MIVKSHIRKGRVVKQHTRVVRQHFNPKRMKYDKASKTLTITYPFGAQYSYHNVPSTITKRIGTTEESARKALAYVKENFSYKPVNKTAKTIFRKAEKNRAKKSKLK